MDAVTPKDLMRAYIDCRKRKRNTPNSILFEQNLCSNLVTLLSELNNGTYYPGTSTCFVVRNPKPREVFAADFRDRIVHHLVVRELEKYWERVFIYDSYACRKGKGTLAAVERLHTFMRKVTVNGTRRAWFLQCDIKNFFMSIRKEKLVQFLDRGLKKQFKSKTAAPEWLRHLSHLLVMHSPTTNFVDKSRPEEWRCVPYEKSLFYAADGCGLPIGNLTSQFFANIYMNELDQFVKHTLKAKYYIRYVDDFVLLSGNKQQLHDWLTQIQEFLKEHLSLNLKSEIKLCPVHNGINFLGYVQHVHHRLMRRRVVSTLKGTLFLRSRPGSQQTLKGPFSYSSLCSLRSILNSFFAFSSKSNGRKDYATAITLHKRWLKKYFIFTDTKVVLKPYILFRHRRDVRLASFIFPRNCYK